MRIAGRRVACGPDAREMRWRRRRRASEPVWARIAPESAAPGPDDALDPESRLAALARSGGALRRVVCVLAGRVTATKAWERLGFARPGDYAVEALGLAPRTLQEWARVDGALSELPRTEAALAEGLLPWSKVRLLARAATREDEALWVEAAKRLTVRQLERQVRAVARHAVGAEDEVDEDGGSTDEQETVQVRCTGIVNAKWWTARRLAQRVAGQKLPVWGCMELVAAEVLSAIPMDVPEAEPTGKPIPSAEKARAADVCGAQQPSAEPEEPVPEGEGGTVERGGAEPAPPVAFPACLAAPLAGLAELDAAELHQRLGEAVRQEQRREALMAPLLARVARGRLYRMRGFPSIAAYARERLGISERKARALLRVERAARRCPALLAAYGEGRISWVKAHALVPVLLPDGGGRFHANWIARARRGTVRRLDQEVGEALVLLETDRARFLATGGLPAELEQREQPGQAQTGAHGERQTCAEPTDPQASLPPREGSRIFFLAPVDQARFFRAALCRVRLRLERELGRLPTEGEALEAMLDHCLDTWSAWEGRKRYPVFERDGWRCTVAGCSSYRNLQDHHIVFRSRGGSDDLSNRTTVCAFHHHRGIHAGRIRCLGVAPHRLRFELGLREGRSPLFVYEGDAIVS